MNIVLLQAKLRDDELNSLMEEFPQYLFLTLSEFSIHKLDKRNWERVEVFYGGHLNSEELAMAKNLRWIHTTTPHFARLSMDEIVERGNILVTSTKEENITQVGEFVIGSILMFAKNLHHWKEADVLPDILWDSKWRDSMWSLESKTLLQIGLGKFGTEITKQCKQMGMRTWGVKEKRSFHPHCQKTFSFSELNSVLPNADIVSLAMPRELPPKEILGADAFHLMKEDSILIILGDRKFINEEALANASKEGKFRGILIDAPFLIPIPISSPLWGIENMVITPEVSARPKAKDGEAFHVFRHNLRQYVHENFLDMSNLFRGNRK
ncbi:MAG: NAD(P)-dependent oxidoreductase [Waddliaceae bacterium]